jgi:NADPH:quinone reductase-like Zn-dependent oxidoreductase
VAALRADRGGAWVGPERKVRCVNAIIYTAYGSPDVLHLTEVATPTPKDNEVLVRIHAAVVSRGDVTARRGSPFSIRLATGFVRPKKPILGTNLAGVIEAIGKHVTRFKPGDEVFAATGADFGAHAEYICLPEDGALAPKPVNATYADAAAICEGGLTALPFLRDQGKMQPGHHVLINGASGAVGSSAVQLAKAFGAEVTAVCGSSNLELVRSLGADTVIDYRQQDFTQSGQTYDMIFDTVGNRSFAQCRSSLRDEGIYVTTILTLAAYPQMLWTTRFGRKKARIAFSNFRPAREKVEDLLVLTTLTATGKLIPVIDRRFPMAQAAEAHRRVESGHKTGSVVITMDHPE